MELVFGFVLIAGLIFGVPVIALIVASKASHRAERLQGELDRLLARLQYTENFVAQLARKLVAQERAGLVAEPPPSPPVVAPLPSEAKPASEPIQTEAEAPPEPLDAPPPEPASPAGRTPEPAVAPPTLPEMPEPPSPGFDWENLIGVRLFAWIGGGALFLGAALFLHYSIQQNLISPPVRVAIGLFFGAACLFGGDRLRERTDMAGQAVAGAGVAILYAALFAARTLYHLIDAWLAFGGMALVTLTAGAVAVRRGTLLVALLGLLGGMATPYLLSTGEDRPVSLLIYVALLDAGVLFVAGKRKWPVLSLIGLASSVVLFTGWASRYLTAGRVPYALLALAGVCGLFALLGTRVAIRRESKNWDLVRIVTLLAALVPLAAAAVLSPMPTLAIEPWALALHLVLVLGLAWAASRSAELPMFVAFAAALAVVALVLRVDGDLFPNRSAATLISFSLPAAACLAAWVVRRREPDGTAIRLATTLMLVGSAAVALRIVDIQPPHELLIAPLIYVGSHGLALVAIGAMQRNGRFVAAAHGVCAFVLTAYVTASGATEQLAVPLVISGLSFWAVPFLAERLRSGRSAWISSALALPVHFALTYVLTGAHWPAEWLGLGAIGCAALSLISLQQARRHAEAPADRLLYSALFAGETLAFVTTAVPILLDKEWITVAWALEVAALCWLRLRAPHRGLYYAIAILAAAVSLRLLTNPALWLYHPRSDTPLLNFYLYTFGVPALSFFAGATWLSREAEPPPWQLPALLRLLATVFVFVLLNVEVADYYSTSSTLTFNFSGGGLAQDMTYSLVWGGFAVALLVIGIARRSKAPRIGSLVVLTLTIAKVFLHDLWELGSLYRVGSIIGLALALLGVSFLIQRFILKKEPA